MADVVGTALVRIKALTDKLANDIKKDVKKSMKNAKLDKIAEAEGEKFGEEFGDSTADAAGKTIKKRSKDFVGGDSITDEWDDVTKDIRKKFQQLDLDDAFRGVQENFEQLSFDLPEFDDIEIDVDVDTDPAEKAFAKIRQDSDRTGNDLRNGSLSNALDSLNAKFKSLGDDSLPHIGRLTKAIGLIGGAIIAALPYIQDVGAAVLAYVTGLVAQVGFLVTALGGLGVAAAAAIGGAVTAALPIFLAFQAETEALVEFKDAAAAAGEEFLRIGVATQQTLLPALDEALFVLGDLVPIFSEFGLFVGRAVGNYAKLATGVLVGEVAQGRLQSILQSSLRILDLLLPSLLHFGDLLSGIWVAAIPASERFVGSIHDLAERWAEMVNEGLRTGELTEKFNLWYDRAAILGSALGDLSGALFDILEVGATSADGVFRRFDEWAERFRNFTESEAGQNRLALIFDNALAVMREVNAVAADLFDGIFGRLGEVGGVDSMVEALQRFRDVIPQIQEFWANAYVEIKRVVEIFASNIWEKITQAWEQMSEPLGRLGEQLLELLDVMNDSGAFEVFLDLMEILTNTLATLLAIPGFGQFVAYFLAFGAALKVTKLVLGPFVGVFSGFVGVFAKLIAISKVGALAGATTALSKIATGAQAIVAAKGAGAAVDAVGAAAKAAAPKAAGMASAITGVSGGLSALGPVGITAGIAVGVAGLAFFSAQQRAQRWRQEIRQVTEALGLLNDGLNITTEGVTKYVNEFSRFEGRDQIDDLERMGLSVAELGEQVANGTLSYVEFADKALASGEVFVTINDRTKDTTSTLADLTKQYGLSNDELIRLAKGEEVYADGTKLVIEGNDSVLDSFVELNKVLGAAALESIDGFISNAQNIRLLGPKILNDLKKEIEDARPEDADQILGAAQDQLAAAAIKSSAAIKGLSEATREQIREQATLADGTVDVVRENELLYNAQKKLTAQIREDLELFANIEIGGPFEAARASAVQFSLAVNDMDFGAFQELATSGGVDALLEKFPGVGAAADDLFQKLRTLPTEEFNAFATSLNLDADSLRESMEGAEQAVANLQETALEKLPSIGKLLDDATSTDPEGTQIFNDKAFLDSVNKRIGETERFGDNLVSIADNISQEAATLALQQGPKAAESLASMVGTGKESQIQQVLTSMERAETRLKDQIRTIFAPGIAAQYLAMAQPVSEGWGIGLANGINSEATIEALRGSSLDTLNYLARGFQGHFEFVGNELRFVHTGVFRRVTSRRTPPPGSADPDRLLFSSGGYVEKYGIAGTFNKSFGTDTVPAMLTPGEFVNNRATVDRLGVDFFEALNSGSTPAVPVGGSPIDASGWTIVAPTPEESARQLISRFRTLSFLLGGG